MARIGSGTGRPFRQLILPEKRTFTIHPRNWPTTRPEILLARSLTRPTRKLFRSDGWKKKKKRKNKKARITKYNKKKNNNNNRKNTHREWEKHRDSVTRASCTICVGCGGWKREKGESKRVGGVHTSYEFTRPTPNRTSGQLPFCFETARIYLPPAIAVR